MRIGFDAKRAFNNQRGLGNYSRETLRILTTLAPDNEYHLFTPSVSAAIDFPCPSRATLHSTKRKSKLSQSLWRSFGITKEAEQLKLDVYHGLSHELPYGIEKTQVRSIVTMHDLLFLKHPEFFPAFDRMMYRKKYLHSCQIADRVITVSEQTKRDLLELTDLQEEKVEVVYQGCRPEFKKTVDEKQRQELRTKYHLPDAFLLNVGAIEPRKNQKLICDAIAAGHIDLPLVIAGRATAFIDELRQQIHQLNLEGQVILLSDLPSDELPTLYQCATAFVFPSLYEGFGIPVIEALESGLPVIAATGSCLEESGGPDSLYVAPSDGGQWAEAILKVLDDEDLRHHMSVKGREYAQRFSDESICKQLTRIYKNLLS